MRMLNPCSVFCSSLGSHTILKSGLCLMGLSYCVDRNCLLKEAVRIRQIMTKFLRQFIQAYG